MATTMKPGVVTGEHICAEAGGLGDELHLGSLQVDRHVDPFEQLGNTTDLVAHHRASDVVGVVVRGEHADEPHPVRLQDVQHTRHVVRWVDDDRFACLPIADQIAEVDHLLCDQIAGGEVPPTQELPEIEAVIHGSDSRLGSMIPSTRRIAYLGPAGTFTEQALLG